MERESKDESEPLCFPLPPGPHRASARMGALVTLFRRRLGSAFGSCTTANQYSHKDCIAKVKNATFKVAPGSKEPASFSVTTVEATVGYRRQDVISHGY